MRAEAPRRSAEEEARRAEAHRRRAIDWDDPRSVLGLPSSGRISPRALEAAFRKELFAWHPDRNPSSQAEAAERTGPSLRRISSCAGNERVATATRC